MPLLLRYSRRCPALRVAASQEVFQPAGFRLFGNLFLLTLLPHLEPCSSVYRVAGWPWAPFRPTRNAPVIASFFRSEWAPLGCPGDRNFDAGARFRAPFLGLSLPFWGV